MEQPAIKLAEQAATPMESTVVAQALQRKAEHKRPVAQEQQVVRLESDRLARSALVALGTRAAVQEAEAEDSMAEAVEASNFHHRASAKLVQEDLDTGAQQPSLFHPASGLDHGREIGHLPVPMLPMDLSS